MELYNINVQLEASVLIGVLLPVLRRTSALDAPVRLKFSSLEVNHARTAGANPGHAARLGDRRARAHARRLPIGGYP